MSNFWGAVHNFYILRPFSAYPPPSIDFPCKVKAGVNQQGAASFAINNHQLASSLILLNTNGTVRDCCFLLALFPPFRLVSRM